MPDNPIMRKKYAMKKKGKKANGKDMHMMDGMPMKDSEMKKMMKGKK